MRLKILEHYHGKLSGNRHLNKDEEYDVPGDVLTQEAADELVNRGRAAWLTTRAAQAMEKMTEAVKPAETAKAETKVMNSESRRPKRG